MEKESVIVTVGKEEKKQVELVKLEMDGIEWEAGNLSQKEPDIDTIFKEYEQLMDNETEFDIKFATASALGKLSVMDGQIRIRMVPEEMDGPVWDGRTRSIMHDGRRYTTMLLAKTYRVRIIKVDRKNKSVFVSERAVHKELREKVIEKITDMVSVGKHVMVPARVIGVCPQSTKLVVVSIGDLGIPGIIRKEDWARCYVANLSETAQPGKMITVAVKGLAKWSEVYGLNRAVRQSKIYECSRAETILKDPWEGVETYYPIKTGVRVRCVHALPGRFFAEIDGLEDINALCYIKEGEEDHIKPEIGREYLGFVYMVNESEHKLKVRIIDELPKESSGIIDEFPKEPAEAEMEENEPVESVAENSGSDENSEK